MSVIFFHCLTLVTNKARRSVILGSLCLLYRCEIQHGAKKCFSSIISQITFSVFKFLNPFIIKHGMASAGNLTRHVMMIVMMI